ncbi:MAG TPA: tetratricopeptide repeat protein [Bacteroidia bacterium]|nr:tetratricopeptide repeat protein [Bacteroidia bacterium]
MYFSSEWLKQRLSSISDRQLQIEEQIIFMTSASDFLVEECYAICLELLEEGEKTGNPDLCGFALLGMSYYHRMHGNMEKGNALESRLENLLPEMKESFPTAIVLQMLAFNYWSVGQRDRAFEYAYSSARMTEKIGGEGRGWSAFQFGVFYSDMKDYDLALENFTKAEAQSAELGLVYQLARSRSGIAGVHLGRNRLEESLAYNRLALEGYRSCGHQTALSRALNDLGVITRKLGNNAEAETYLREALSIRELQKYVPGIITSQMELAHVLIANGDSEESGELLGKALALAERTGSKQKIAECHRLLSELYKLKKEPWKALEHLDKFHEVRSGIAGEEASNRIQHLQQKFATEKSRQEAEIHRLRNVELKKAYEEIEEKNRSITDSIHYAKRIQRALLATDSFIARYVPEFFVLYKPKDIVSGDFYWAAAGTGNREQGAHLPDDANAPRSFYIAACDCTGHGVPGAFMSLLSFSFLNEAINERKLSLPGNILGYVREKLVTSISDDGQRDGMDCTLVSFDDKKKQVAYAAAYNAPVLVRNGEVKELSADKMPVGKSENATPFSTFTCDVQEGDVLYLFTDGYADQFGGPRGKKLRHKNLLRILGEINHLPLAEQKSVLEERHAEWKGDLEQLDDILIMGLRI